MSIKSRLIGQFKRPTGLLGHLAGHIMANRGSNRARNSWTTNLLDLKPEHHVLEFGCGPGLALVAAAAQCHAGHVTGVDHSEVMLAQAKARLASNVAASRVTLSLGGLEQVAAHTTPLDRIYSVNAIQFVPDIDQAYRVFLHALKPGGVCAATYQPRTGDISREAAYAMAEIISGAMETAGFVAIRTEELGLKPVPAICVLGEKPDV